MVPAKRAMLYISRKKGKTLSLFMTVFVIAVFLFSCFGVLNASEKLSKDVRSSVGAAFYIRATTKIEGGEYTYAGTKITDSNIEEIMQLGNIKYCDPVNYGYVKIRSLRFIPGEGDSDDNNMGRVAAHAYSALAPDFTEKTSKLTEGRHFTDGDKRKILISDKLAEKNSLKTGDTVTLTHARLGIKDGIYFDEIPVKTENVRAEIAGIYKTDSKNTSMLPTAELPENCIYASLDILEALKESEKGIYTGEVGFYLNDPKEMSETVSKVQNISSVNWDDHFIRTNDYQFSRISDRLASMGDLMGILIVIVSVVSAALLTLLLSLRIRGRMHETGILLAGGISKRDILLGFMTEVMVVTAVALLLSYGAAQLLTGIIGNRLFDGIDPDLIGGDFIKGTDHIKDLSVYLRPDAAKTAGIYLCQAAVAAMATLLSSVTVIRLKPKDILSRMS